MTRIASISRAFLLMVLAACGGTPRANGQAIGTRPAAGDVESADKGICLPKASALVAAPESYPVEVRVLSDERRAAIEREWQAKTPDWTLAVNRFGHISDAHRQGPYEYIPPIFSASESDDVVRFVRAHADGLPAGPDGWTHVRGMGIVPTTESVPRPGEPLRPGARFFKNYHSLSYHADALSGVDVPIMHELSKDELLARWKRLRHDVTNLVPCDPNSDGKGCEHANDRAHITSFGPPRALYTIVLDTRTPGVGKLRRVLMLGYDFGRDTYRCYPKFVDTVTGESVDPGDYADKDVLIDGNENWLGAKRVARVSAASHAPSIASSYTPPAATTKVRTPRGSPVSDPNTASDQSWGETAHEKAMRECVQQHGDDCRRRRRE